MKTVEEILKEHGVLNVYDSVNCSKYDIIHLMNVYAKQVSKEALKNAANNVDSENCFRYSSERNTYDIVEQSILSESNIPSL